VIVSVYTPVSLYPCAITSDETNCWLPCSSNALRWKVSIRCFWRTVPWRQSVMVMRYHSGVL